MPDHDYIYRHQAEQYERLISRQPGLLPVISGIRRVQGLDVADAGAGTGRIAAAVAPYVRSVTALDQSAAMLEVAASRLAALRPEGWICIPAANDSLPLQDSSVDLVVSGWSVCYSASSVQADWSDALARVQAEFRRVLRPGGTVILFETMGTGCTEPCPPASLIPYYRELEEHYGFSHKVIRLDYTFTDAGEAEELTGFFFGEELALQVRERGSPIVPECAGVWWLHT